MSESSDQHWEKIFASRESNEHSWFEPSPKTSLALLKQCRLKVDAHIIDVGAGDSRLVDALLDEGFTHIHVLDISRMALEQSRRRLGDRCARVDWIVSDVLDYRPDILFDAWHDRAAFHFQVTDDAVRDYANLVSQCVRPGGCLVIGTFSLHGPKTCSGLPIRQYNSELLSDVFQEGFILEASISETHITPSDASQDFIFCRFRRRQ